jgi:hypothetical protein
MIECSDGEKKENYLLINLKGVFEVNSLGVVIDKVLTEVAREQYARVLLDARGVKGAPSILERFQFATLFAANYLKARAQGSIPSCRFALLGEEPMVDPKRFGEKVANNRGLSVRVFLSESEAIEWLRQG